MIGGFVLKTCFYCCNSKGINPLPPLLDQGVRLLPVMTQTQSENPTSLGRESWARGKADGVGHMAFSFSAKHCSQKDIIML